MRGPRVAIVSLFVEECLTDALANLFLMALNGHSGESMMVTGWLL